MRCLCWLSGMRLCRILTMLALLQHRQAAPNPAASNRWMTWINSLMTKMMVPTHLHVPICCFLLRCFPPCRRSFLVAMRFPHFSCFHIFFISSFCFLILHTPFFFCGYSIFLFSLLPHFPKFPLLVFNVADVFFLVFATTMFVVFQGGSPMINGFSIVSRPPVFALGFVFSISGGGGGQI